MFQEEHGIDSLHQKAEECQFPNDAMLEEHNKDPF